MEHRQEKIESLLARFVGEFLSQEAGPMSLITVTNVRFNEKTKRALVMLTVLPENKEQTALDFVKRKSSEMRRFIKEKISMRILPIFDFVIDMGEKNRQMVDSISAQDVQRTGNSQ